MKQIIGIKAIRHVLVDGEIIDYMAEAAVVVDDNEKVYVYASKCNSARLFVVDTKSTLEYMIDKDADNPGCTIMACYDELKGALASEYGDIFKTLNMIINRMKRRA